MNKSINFVCLLLLLHFSIISQSNFIADSLKCIELNYQAETAKEGIWQQKNRELYNFCIATLKNSGYKSKHVFFEYYLAKATANIAYNAGTMNDTAIAFQAYSKALQIYTKLNYTNDVSVTKYDLAELYYKNGQTKRALKLLKEVEASALASNDTSIIIETLNLSGIIHRNNANTELCLQNYYAALKLAELQKDLYRVSFLRNNIGVVFSENSEHQKALLNYIEGLNVRKKLLLTADNPAAVSKIKSGIASSYMSLGVEHFQIKQIDSAYFYLQKAFVTKKEIGDKRGIAESYYQLGLIYDYEKKFDSAYVYFENSFNLSREMNDLLMMCNSCNFQTISMFRQNKKQMALKNAEECFKYTLQLGYPAQIQSAAQSLKFIYKDLGKYKESLEMMELEIKMRDSINNESNKKASIKSQLKYEYEKKAAADSVKAAEEKKVVDAQLKQEKTQRLALYGGLGLVGIFSLFMVNRFRVTNKQKKLIEEQKEIVERQKHLVEEKQKEIIDSITYARRIQTALITNEHYIKNNILRLKL